jgi:hypothetical protein
MAQQRTAAQQMLEKVEKDLNRPSVVTVTQ